MNKKAQKTLIGFALLTVALVLLLAALSTIDVFKESLDEVRGNENLNCPGTPNFNQTTYDEDTGTNNATVRRPTCFVTGISMVWFIGAFLLALVSWIVGNFRKAK